MEIIQDVHRVKARKEHKCSYCGRIIQKGDSYFKTTLKDNYVYDWKECTLCHTIIITRIIDWEDYPDGLSSYDFIEECANFAHSNGVDIAPEDTPQTIVDKVAAYIVACRLRDLIIDWSLKDKTEKMEPFDLEEAKKGKPISTAGGNSARIICYDAKHSSGPCIVALITLSSKDEEIAVKYHPDGSVTDLTLFANDLKLCMLED